MILKINETCDVRKWKLVESDNKIILELIFWTDYFIYSLNEREEVLFKNGLEPVEVLRTYYIGETPIITVTRWKHPKEN